VTSPFPALDTPGGRTVLRWVIGIVLVLGLIGCVTKGANNPADPYLASPGGSSGRIPLPNFGETRISVHTADNQLLAWCLLLAATADQRRRGLMQVTDPTLGGYDGMLFRYDHDIDPTTEAFWMRNTPMPLSIAYLDNAGKVVTITDIAPCADTPQCPSYPAAGAFRTVIEVPQGTLTKLAIDPTVTVVDEKTTCA
jgi:uncharacterized membrane protein (UPF0127 family)